MSSKCLGYMSSLLIRSKFDIFIKASLPEADRHDTSAIYKQQTLASLEEDIPEFNWRLYLQTFVKTELPNDEPIVSYAYQYLKEMAFIVKATEPRYMQ